MAAIEDLQKRLIELYYLDPPVGVVGQQTLGAIENFRINNQLLKTATTEEILKVANNQKPAELRCKTQLVRNVIDECDKQGFWLSRGTDAPNIIYIEGLDRDGTVNNNRIDEWNDVRTLLTIEFNGYAYFTNIWACTVNTGRYYTDHPMNKGGAANIVIPQQVFAWQIGRHITKNNNQDALVQMKPVRVARDASKDGRTADDPIEDFGVIGLNQHYGSGDLVGQWSAGCLVGSTSQGHADFMAKLRRDRRWIINPNYIFSTIILNGYKVAII